MESAVEADSLWMLLYVADVLQQFAKPLHLTPCSLSDLQALLDNAGPPSSITGPSLSTMFLELTRVRAILVCPGQSVP